MKRIIDRIKYWGQLFLLPIYWLSFLVPRNKKIWLFGSTFGRRFADNPRYLYQQISENKQQIDIRPIWITRNKDVVAFLQDNEYEAYYLYSCKGLWYCIRGAVYIFDNYSKDICFWLSGGAKKINLWHGVGNKKINHDNKFDYLRHPRNMKERWSTWITRLSNEKPSHYVLVTSPYYVDIFASAFQVPKSHIIQSQYPRNMVLTKQYACELLTKEEDEVQTYLKSVLKKNERIVLYMPTFRPSEKLFFEVMDMQIFNDFLKKHSIIFAIKAHPKSKMKNVLQEISLSNIYVINDSVDPYTFLSYTDMLVSDYSSILTDYLLLDRPIITFAYDLDEYENNGREGSMPFFEYNRTEIVYTMDQLMDKIDVLLQEDTNKEHRNIMLNRSFCKEDKNGMDKLVQDIKTIINGE